MKKNTGHLLSCSMETNSSTSNLTKKSTFTSDLRLALVARGFKEIPKSANTIKKMVVDYSKSMRGIITKQISDIKLNKKFSLTFDEWTSETSGI